MTSLYRLLDADGALLYIGIADSWTHRLHTHAREKSWWGDVAECRVQHFPSRTGAVEAERRAIESEHPRHNRHLNAAVSPPPLRIRIACPTCGRQVMTNGRGLSGHLNRRSKRCDGVRWLSLSKCRELGIPPGVAS